MRERERDLKEHLQKIQGAAMMGPLPTSLLFLGALGVALVDSYCVEKGKNLAPEGKPSQSSVYHSSGMPQNAIDGNRNGLYRMRSCILTKSESSPWWRLDLHKPQRIGAVVIVNRKDCCWDRVKKAEVRIGNSTMNQNPVCGTITEAEPGLVTRLCCGGMVGRYVSIVIPDREDILNLCEVEIYPEGTEKPCV